MKTLRPSELHQWTSRWIDGDLLPHEARVFEAYLAEHPEAHKEVDELKRLKLLLSNQPKLSENIGFWTRVHAAMEARVREDDANLLPFPRKYAPIAVALGIVGLMVVGVVTLRNRQSVTEFVQQQAQTVRKAYDESVLKGSVLPLFTNLDKEKALEFGLTGTLPLDSKSGTTLRIDENLQKGYRIEVGKFRRAKAPSVTMKEFLADIRPTAKQQKVIDTLLDYARNRIERSVFVGENDALAIDPNLPKLNKVLVSGIAACLEPMQRDRFDRFLASSDAPYVIKSRATKAMEFDKVMRQVAAVPQLEHFVIVSPETLLLCRMQINLDRVHDQMRNMEMRAELEMRRARLVERFSKEVSRSTRPARWPASPAKRGESGRPHAVFDEENQLDHSVSVRTAPITSQRQNIEFNVGVMPRVRKFITDADRREVHGFSFYIEEDSSTDRTENRVPRIHFYQNNENEMNIELSGGDSLGKMLHIRFQQDAEGMDVQAKPKIARKKE
ncbi:MAG: hypothetical protein HY966_03010 [Ignavibacteriales bacterium]|nr:hypothetical protein [Ignavibacteriales bacterium]